MPRKKGEISPRKAAKLVGVHIDTMYEWCRAAHRGKPSMLDGAVRRDSTKHYWINREFVDDLADNY